MADDEPKIIIDEGWKAQVQREKEEALRAPDEEEASGEEEGQELPGGENYFTALVNSLAAQCMLALGIIAPRDSQQVTVDIDQAKFTIDTLMMLREKTKGNLTPEEEGLLTEATSELQRAYVLRAQQVQEAALKSSGVSPKNLKQQ